MFLEHRSEAARINTATVTDLSTLAAALLANFCTIRLPASEDGLAKSVPTRANWFQIAKARRAERLAVHAYRDRIRRDLVGHGHHQFFHHLEPDPEGGWRLHFFVADEPALSILVDISKGQSGPGDPVDLDPEEFIRDRLGRLKGMASDFE
jgi:hypothetical protein